MSYRLENQPKVVGVKQSKRAILEGKAACVFLAQDADPKIIDPLRQLCGEHNVPVETAATMKQLGDACKISVGAAVAVVLK